ncbi:low molecular weight protein-tyrosine-phosphatase [Chryseobacterium caseinilyticum]|uniref:protein-tyrosine-phosphatase n=1 Tax=Chryseobacterium caseinilyticum TaxID=2771428 RepID=A0ABR8Z7H0_9FLAO|nr:low molecular weight protein-tyrosine-phosphatase [Chryseobacterium caseinilyticum]MBD8081248.1 low molecular weight phosphotyrosine protein phosphatase [Chryseobacterium caseinilyticum]
MKILMVCLGNICRSPLAEGILKSKLPANFTVDSAGTINMHEGNAPDKRSVEVASKNGLDISKQQSRHFQPHDLDDYDRIYCMDKNNLRDVLSLATTAEQRQKVFLLMDSLNLNHHPTEVPDPYWSGSDGFDQVYRQIDEACEMIAKNLERETSNIQR